MKVSVIMSVYNIGDMDILKEAVNSILDQSFTDLELIVCDDASTDDTYYTVKKMASSESRIVILRNSVNIKAGGSRNRCIEMAHGDYIAIMDGDDVSHPDRIAKQVEFLDSRPDIDFVGTRSRYFEHEPGDSEKGYWFCSKPQKKDFLYTLPFLHPTLMFRRESLEKVGGYSSRKLVTRCEDYDMLLRMYAVGLKGENIDEVLYYYRHNRASYGKRKYRYRFNEVAVKWKGFYRCGLFPIGIAFAIKPLIVGLVPKRALDKLKKMHYKDC